MKKGFTIIEILLVLTLSTFIIGFVSLSFSKINENEVLDQSTELVVSVLNEARTMTLSAVDDSRYGVHFDTSQVIFFKGATYDSAAANNVPTLLNSLVGIGSITLVGGGSDVVFNRLTGATNQAGTLRVYLKSATTTYRTVIVGVAGLVERN